MITLGSIDIEKAYLGGTEVSEIYLGEDLVFGGIDPSVLPYDAEVEYLESSGTQWINTGIKPTNTLSFSCTFDNPNNSGAGNGYGNVFGSRIASNSNEYQLTKFGSGSVSVGKRNSGKRFNTSGIHTVTFDGGTTITVDGTTSTITKASIQENIGNIVLFGISQGASTSATQLQAGKIYSCSFGSLRDFIPVRKNGVGYMYDRVSGELFGNSGTGSFTYGNDVTN